MSARGRQPVQDGAVFEIIAIDDVLDPLLRQGIDYWNSLRGSRAFPARDQIVLRAIASLLSRTVLIKVIDGGRDFEYVVVGDDVGRAYSAPLIHRRISDIAKEMPTTIGFWGGVYRRICQEKKPVAVSLQAGIDGEARFSDGTVVCLPLGETDAAVDHMITFGKRTLIRT